MNTRDNDFLETLLRNIKNSGTDMSKDLVISQRAFLIAVRTYFEIKQEKTLKNHASFFVKEGMFELCNGDFLVTEKAKRMFGCTPGSTSGITIKPDKVNKIG